MLRPYYLMGGSGGTFIDLGQVLHVLYNSYNGINKPKLQRTHILPSSISV